MATNTHTLDFQNTLPAVDANTAAPRARRVPGANADGLAALLSPARVVAVIGVLAVVVLLLASIAGVAKAQVRKGSEFQFAKQAAPATATTLYSNRGGTQVAALGE